MGRSLPWVVSVCSWNSSLRSSYVPYMGLVRLEFGYAINPLKRERRSSMTCLRVGLEVWGTGSCLPGSRLVGIPFPEFHEGAQDLSIMTILESR